MNDTSSSYGSFSTSSYESSSTTSYSTEGNLTDRGYSSSTDGYNPSSSSNYNPDDGGGTIQTENGGYNGDVNPSSQSSNQTTSYSTEGNMTDRGYSSSMEGYNQNNGTSSYGNDTGTSSYGNESNKNNDDSSTSSDDYNYNNDYNDSAIGTVQDPSDPNAERKMAAVQALAQINEDGEVAKNNQGKIAENYEDIKINGNSIVAGSGAYGEDQGINDSIDGIPVSTDVIDDAVEAIDKDIEQSKKVVGGILRFQSEYGDLDMGTDALNQQYNETKDHIDKAEQTKANLTNMKIKLEEINGNLAGLFGGISGGIHDQLNQNETDKTSDDQITNDAVEKDDKEASDSSSEKEKGAVTFRVLGASKVNGEQPNEPFESASQKDEEGDPAKELEQMLEEGRSKDAEQVTNPDKTGSSTETSQQDEEEGDPAKELEQMLEEGRKNDAEQVINPDETGSSTEASQQDEEEGNPAKELEQMLEEGRKNDAEQSVNPGQANVSGEEQHPETDKNSDQADMPNEVAEERELIYSSPAERGNSNGQPSSQNQGKAPEGEAVQQEASQPSTESNVPEQSSEEQQQLETGKTSIEEILADPEVKGTTDAEKIVNAYNSGKIDNRNDYKEAMAHVNRNTGRYVAPSNSQSTSGENNVNGSGVKPETSSTQNEVSQSEQTPEMVTETNTPPQEINTQKTSGSNIEAILADPEVKGTTDAEKIVNAYNSGKIDNRNDYKEAMAHINRNTGRYVAPANSQSTSGENNVNGSGIKSEASSTQNVVSQSEQATEVVTGTSSSTQKRVLDANTQEISESTMEGILADSNQNQVLDDNTQKNSMSTIEAILADPEVKGTTDAEKITNAYNSGKIDNRNDYKEALKNIDPNTGKYKAPVSAKTSASSTPDTTSTSVNNQVDAVAMATPNIPDEKLIEELKNLYDLDTREGRACYVYDILTKEYDYSHDGALAAMAHILGTNGTFDPGRYQGDNPDNPGFGLFQWEYINKYGAGCGSAIEMENWCKQNGYKHDSIEGQIAWLNHYIPIKEADYYHDTGTYINLEQELKSGSVDFGTLVKHFGDVHQGMQNSEIKNPTREWGARNQLFPIIARKDDYLKENAGKYSYYDLPRIHTSQL